MRLGESMREDAQARGQLGKQLQKMKPISILAEDLAALIAARRDVVAPAGNFDPQWPGHGEEFLYLRAISQAVNVHDFFE